MTDKPKHAGGRPTKYCQDILDIANEYINDYTDYGDIMPSHIGMFLHMGISKTCGYDWDKDPKKAEFSAILEKCNMMQHQKLINNGLNGQFNSAIVKLALGKHGYHDKQHTELSGVDGKPIEIDTVWEVKVID